MTTQIRGPRFFPLNDSIVSCWPHFATRFCFEIWSFAAIIFWVSGPFVFCNFLHLLVILRFLTGLLRSHLFEWRLIQYLRCLRHCVTWLPCDFPCGGPWKIFSLRDFCLRWLSRICRSVRLGSGGVGIIGEGCGIMEGDLFWKLAWERPSGSWAATRLELRFCNWFTSILDWCRSAL